MSLLEKSHPSDPGIGQNRELYIAGIANSIDAAWMQAKSIGVQKKFLEKIDRVVENTKSGLLPNALLAPRKTVQSRRQPGLIEAISETTKRLRFVENLKDSLPESVVGLVIGGSVSYGRFFNVRGEPDPSDLDILMVVRDDFFRNGDGEGIVNTDNGFDPATSLIFSDRLKIFMGLFEENKAQMMSIKSPVDGYLASIKVIPEKTFQYEFVTVPENVGQGTNDALYVVNDYKQGLYPSNAFTQYNFSHEPFVFSTEDEYETEMGAITPVPCAIVKNGRFYTGQHQNHVIPRFEVELDRDGSINEAVLSFKKYLFSRLEFERSVFGSEVRAINILDRRNVLSSLAASGFDS